MSRHLLQPDKLDSLSACAPDLAQVFVSLASDIALVIDLQGNIVSVAQESGEPLGDVADDWVGRPWIDTVTSETRIKIQRLLSDLASTGLGRRRQVNHASGQGGDIPVAYTALRLGASGPVLAVGRDLRADSAIQQRFLNTQQEIERGYWRERQTESRHRMLLHVATDAVLTVTGDTLCIVEVNAAAVTLLQRDAWPVSSALTLPVTGALAGCEIEHQFDAHSRPVVRDMLLRVQAGGLPAEVQVRLAGTHISVGLQALRLHTANQPRLLLRARTAEPLMQEAFPLGTALMQLVKGALDGVLATDAQGHLVAANRAFVRMVQGADEDAVRGCPLTDWLGPDSALEVDGNSMQTLLCKLRERGIIQLERQQLRRAGLAPLLVDVTATLLAERDQAGMGFILQPVPQGVVQTPAPSAPKTSR